MKNKEEIEKLANEFYLKKAEEINNSITRGFIVSASKGGFVQGYTKCQEDMQKEIDSLKSRLREFEGKEPKYAIQGDYCAVCGCTEFWNDEEE